MTQADLRKQSYYALSGMDARLARRYYACLGPARRILDVGCGTGEFGRHRPSDEHEIVGVDVDAGAVELARGWEDALQLELGRDALPFEDASFDGVLAKDVLEHLAEPWWLVQELQRVLRPGGVVVASVVVAKPRRVWADYTHVRGFTRRTAVQLFEDCGLPVERIWRMGGVPLSTRLGFLDAVPTLLRFPLFDALWTSSWELVARKAATGGAGA